MKDKQIYCHPCINTSSFSDIYVKLNKVNYIDGEVVNAQKMRNFLVTLLYFCASVFSNTLDDNRSFVGV
ncbi:MAG: hypothetical protein Sylvanvirus1_82 [Sylvanvirus sp.]|uniref:Uncharacterized protein n=1 Tax=Sylvanvirus sp. TaxID=2487774 RepID=A0A3G5AGY9_9VIRU|nr:MAG: hypothetical protein Sylvanvirus1_82 [Sylvanvirus sp.]